MAKKKRFGNPQKQAEYETAKKQEQKENSFDKLEQHCIDNDINFERLLTVSFIVSRAGNALARTNSNTEADHRLLDDKGVVNSDGFVPIVTADGGLLIYDGPMSDNSN